MYVYYKEVFTGRLTPQITPHLSYLYDLFRSIHTCKAAFMYIADQSYNTNEPKKIQKRTASHSYLSYTLRQLKPIFARRRDFRLKTH